MNVVNRSFRALVLAVMPVLVGGGTADGMIRKCQVTVNGLPVPVSRGPMLIVDGLVVGDVNMQQGTIGPSNAPLNLESLNIVGMSVGCVEVEEDGQMVGRSSIAIVTRDGAVGLMTTYLSDLVRAQDAFHAANGHYAHNPQVLGFFASRPQFPIQMIAADGRWTATMRFEDAEASCRVSWAIATADTTSSSAEEVVCQ